MLTDDEILKHGTELFNESCEFFSIREIMPRDAMKVYLMAVTILAESIKIIEQENKKACNDGTTTRQTPTM